MNAEIVAAVTVTVLDHGSNAIPGASVSLALTGSGTLGGTLLESTDTTGTATFADLTVSAVGSGDTLTATSGTLSITSDPFIATLNTPTLSFAPSR